MKLTFRVLSINKEVVMNLRVIRGDVVYGG